MKPADWKAAKFASGRHQACWMCAAALTESVATVDHLIPASRGGRDLPGNFALSCKPCNGERGNKPLSAAQRDKIKGREKPKGRDFSGLAAAIKRSL